MATSRAPARFSELSFVFDTLDVHEAPVNVKELNKKFREKLNQGIQKAIEKNRSRENEYLKKAILHSMKDNAS
mgnify:CR=1 FL=1|tara:strand:+ start:771 stop:989 length:219 start_codon:yes stop_codon:yes gene_type:complete